MPSCPDCGYNLTGLELPHRCPECGFDVDPRANAEAALAWYASQRGLFLRRPPPAFARYLGTAEARVIARRRVRRLILLPWLLFTIAFVIVDSLYVETTLEIWGETPDEPGRRYGMYEYERTDRIMGFNLHWGRLLRLAPRNAVKHERVQSRRVGVGWDSWGPFGLIFFGWLPTAALLGLLFGRLALRIARRRVHRLDQAFDAPVGLIGSAVLAPWYALLIVLLVVAAACYTLGEFVPAPAGRWFAVPTGIPWRLAVGVYLLGGFYALSVFLRGCRPRAATFSRAAVTFMVLPGWLLFTVGGWFLVVLTLSIVRMFD